MIVKRLGNKDSIAHLIYPKFPAHSLYIEFFFGAGGMFFNKPKCKRNIVNDLDGDVMNLFMVVKDQMDEFLFLFKAMPLSEDLFYYWIKSIETDPVKKALRFLFLSSFSYMGKNDTFLLLHSQCTHKKKLEYLILKCSEFFETTMFRNVDFRVFLKDVRTAEGHIPNRKRFIYADPPYYGATNNYSVPFTEQDTIDVFQVLVDSGIRFALSELDTPFVSELANSHSLSAVHITHNKSMKSGRNEMIYINYDLPSKTLF